MGDRGSGMLPRHRRVCVVASQRRAGSSWPQAVSRPRSGGTVASSTDGGPSTGHLACWPGRSWVSARFLRTAAMTAGSSSSRADRSLGLERGAFDRQGSPSSAGAVDPATAFAVIRSLAADQGLQGRCPRFESVRAHPGHSVGWSIRRAVIAVSSRALECLAQCRVAPGRESACCGVHAPTVRHAHHHSVRLPRVRHPGRAG